MGTITITIQTITEIVTMLRNSNKYAVIASDEMTTEESIEFLTSKYQPEYEMNVIDNGSHLLIWYIS